MEQNLEKTQMNPGQKEEERLQRIQNAEGYGIWRKVLWVLLALEIGYSILHPRIRMVPFALMTLCYLCKTTKVIRTKEAKRSVASSVTSIIVCGIALYYVTYFPLSIQSWRPWYEYKGDMASLKSNRAHMSFMPDAFPKGVKDKRYENLPSLMQGQGHIRISFTADDDYLQEVISRYEGRALKGYYHDDKFDFVAKGELFAGENDPVTNGSIRFDMEQQDASHMTFYDIDPLSNEFVPEEYSFITNMQCYLISQSEIGDIMYLLYTNGNWNHLSIVYVVINPNTKRVIYYCS